jgi:biopolymer transport protein ExbB
MLEAVLSPFEALHSMRQLGGPIVDWIFIACVVMWAIAIERYSWFRFTLPRETGRMLDVWRTRKDHQSWKSQQIRKAMISRLNSGMSSNLQLLRVLVPLCPLLGLLGTVSGMLDVFDSMAARGSADARTMANGVSEAMICTLTGLAVSITGLYPVYYFQRRVRSETERLVETFAY